MRSRQPKEKFGAADGKKSNGEARRPTHRRGLTGFCGLLLALGLLLSIASQAFAAEEHPLLTTFGNFEFPAGIAADESNGNVFVANAVEPPPGTENNSIQIFGPEGGTPSGLSAPFTIGQMTYPPSTPAPVAVDNSPSSPNFGDVYAAQNPGNGSGDESKLKKFKLGSTGHYELSQVLQFNPNEKDIYGLAVNRTGEVLAANEFTGPLQRFSTSGQEIERINLATSSQNPSDVAVDAQGNVYVLGTFNTSVWKLPANSEGIVTAKSIPEKIVAEGATGIAVDHTTGILYVGMGNRIVQYSPSGVLEAEFGEGTLGQTLKLTVNSANSRIYVNDLTNHHVAVFGEDGAVTGEPAQIGTNSFLARGFAAPEGSLLEECFFEYGTTTSYGSKVPCSQTPTQIGAGKGRVPVTAEIAGLALATNYHYRLVTKQGGVNSEGRDQALKTLSPPVIESVSLKAAASNEATVGGIVNPEGKQTTYFVEYGPTAAYGSVSPTRNVGASKVGESVSTVLTGLASSTTYHWRLVATNEIGTAFSADQTFKTPGAAVESTSACGNQSFRIGPSAALPDCRAFELVSPLDKNNSDIVSLINLNSDPATLDQSALSGERLAYTTSQAFGNAEGAPYVSQYVASRGPDGWTSTGITPPQGISTVNIGRRIDIEYRAFTPDLCSGVLLHNTQPPLTSATNGAVEGLYRRFLCGADGYETLSTPAVPVSTGENEPQTKGVSTDGTCTVFTVTERVYQGCNGTTRPASVLPDGTVVSGVVGTREPGIEPRAGNVSGALSSDGSRLYWSHEGSLYLRVNAEMPQSPVSGGNCTNPTLACTVPIPVASESPSHFMIASTTGAVMYFTHGETLYRFDLATDTSTPIGSDARNSVVGMSEDGSRIVFPSTEDLIAGANVEGATPIVGRANLYLFDANQAGAARYKFIATLSEEDEHRELSTLAFEPQKKIARINSDGTHLVFSSTARLTGYDNTDAVSGQADLEVFSYDENANGGSGGIACLSCNPTGQPPVGRAVSVEGFASNNWVAAYVPPGETELYSSEVQSENGNRVFFDSFDALVPQDTNGQEDVYEWEAPGEGSCRLNEGSYSAPNAGCLTLISSGESPTDSAYVDSDRTGANVFFTTASSLLPQDPGLIDIYDARVEGGFPSPPPPAASCEGEACQGALHPPEDRTPASATYQGPGNVRVAKAKQCVKKAKGKKKSCPAHKPKKKKKSTKKDSQHKKGRKHVRAKNDRRTAR